MKNWHFLGVHNWAEKFMKRGGKRKQKFLTSNNSQLKHIYTFTIYINRNHSLCQIASFFFLFLFRDSIGIGSHGYYYDVSLFLQIFFFSNALPLGFSCSVFFFFSFITLPKLIHHIFFLFEAFLSWFAFSLLQPNSVSCFFCFSK